MRISSYSIVLLLLVCLTNSALAANPPMESRWEKEIAAIEKRTSQLPDPKGRILFLGSSTIRLWNLEQSFPDWPLLNHGFGGSQIGDSVQFFDRLVTAWQPELIVFYGGDNDLAQKKTPDEVRDAFRRLNELVKLKLPRTKLIFIAIKPSPARWNLYDAQTKSNAAIRAIIAEDAERLSYLDVVPPMLNSTGQPREELFVKDQLHLNETGYALWKELLKDHLAQPVPADAKP